MTTSKSERALFPSSSTNSLTIPHTIKSGELINFDLVTSSSLNASTSYAAPDPAYISSQVNSNKMTISRICSFRS
jgi:hypothetical protein